MWKAGGTPVTPAHADWYNALGAEPPVLYWELVTRTDGAGPIPEPPFWQRLKDYDKRTGLQLLGVHSEEAAMVGDRMDTDVIAGMESGLATVLVLSGCTSRTDVNDYPYRPTYILNGVGDIPGK